MYLLPLFRLIRRADLQTAFACLIFETGGNILRLLIEQIRESVLIENNIRLNGIFNGIGIFADTEFAFYIALDPVHCIPFFPLKKAAGHKTKH